MATLTRVEENSGILSYAAAAAGGDEYPNDDDTTLVVKNTSGGAKVVTVAKTRDTVQHRGYPETLLSDIVINFSGDGEAHINAAPAAYNNATNGRASVTVDSATGVSFSVIRRPRR